MWRSSIIISALFSRSLHQPSRLTSLFLNSNIPISRDSSSISHQPCWGFLTFVPAVIWTWRVFSSYSNWWFPDHPLGPVASLTPFPSFSSVSWSPFHNTHPFLQWNLPRWATLSMYLSDFLMGLRIPRRQGLSLIRGIKCTDRYMKYFLCLYLSSKREFVW